MEQQYLPPGSGIRPLNTGMTDCGPHSLKAKDTLSKWPMAVANMYSRFIEDASQSQHQQHHHILPHPQPLSHHNTQPHYQPWTTTTCTPKAETYTSMDCNGVVESQPVNANGSLGSTQVAPVAQDCSINPNTNRTGTGGLGMISADHRDVYMSSADLARKIAALSDTEAILEEDADGGYMQPRSFMNTPQHSPSDLRMLELIRRARLVSTADSGIFPGDDVSLCVSDVSDGAWPRYSKGHDSGLSVATPGPITHMAPSDFNAGRLWRHCAGVQNGHGVADMEGLHLVVDGNMNGLSPRKPSDHVTDRMRRPDSLAVKGHEYEELPASRYQPRCNYADMEDNSSRSGSGGGRPLPVPMLHELKAPAHTDSSDSLCRPLSGTSSNGGMQSDRISNAYRKRENPLYEEGDTDDLQLKPGATGPKSILSCPCSGLIIVGLIACVSFLLALLIVVGTFKTEKDIKMAPQMQAMVDQLNQSELLTALTNMKRLESQYNGLMQKYKVMEAALNMTQLNNGSITSKVDRNTETIQLLLSTASHNQPPTQTLLEKFDQLNSSVRQELSTLRDRASATTARVVRFENDFSQKLSTLGTNVTNQIHKISTLHAPTADLGQRGPSEAANMSKCDYWFKQAGNSPEVASTTTGWWPDSAADLAKWVITGVECTTDYGTTSLMEVQPHPSAQGIHQFRCVCRGAIEGATSRFCILNVWRCPR